eukprot:GHVQ01008595.1.p1 GENE.GHVQ01008595.1~~GHVQ01008595.1.p1  ORF type:complete len:1077 (+),score=111.05 GHVQ01008595.1:3437-6667(+)
MDTLSDSRHSLCLLWNGELFGLGQRTQNFSSRAGSNIDFFVKASSSSLVQSRRHRSTDDPSIEDCFCHGSFVSTSPSLSSAASSSWTGDEADTALIQKLLSSCECECEILCVLDNLEGPFSCVFYWGRRQQLWLCRDKIGRRSLMTAGGCDGQVWVASAGEVINAVVDERRQATSKMSASKGPLKASQRSHDGSAHSNSVLLVTASDDYNQQSSSERSCGQADSCATCLQSATVEASGMASCVWTEIPTDGVYVINLSTSTAPSCADSLMAEEMIGVMCDETSHCRKHQLRDSCGCAYSSQMSAKAAEAVGRLRNNTSKVVHLPWPTPVSFRHNLFWHQRNGQEHVPLPVSLPHSDDSTCGTEDKTVHQTKCLSKLHRDETEACSVLLDTGNGLNVRCRPRGPSVCMPGRTCSVLDEFFTIFQKAVATRTVPVARSQGSVGILFSGGVDSAVIAAMTLQCVPEWCVVELCCACFDPYEAPDRFTALASYEEILRLFPRHDVRLVCVDVTEEEVARNESVILSLLGPTRTHMDFNIGAALWFAARGDGYLCSNRFMDASWWQNLWTKSDCVSSPVPPALSVSTPFSGSIPRSHHPLSHLPPLLSHCSATDALSPSLSLPSSTRLAAQSHCTRRHGFCRVCALKSKDGCAHEACKLCCDKLIAVYWKVPKPTTDMHAGIASVAGCSTNKQVVELPTGTQVESRDITVAPSIHVSGAGTVAIDFPVYGFCPKHRSRHRDKKPYNAPVENVTLSEISCGASVEIRDAGSENLVTLLEGHVQDAPKRPVSLPLYGHEGLMDNLPSLQRPGVATSRSTYCSQRIQQSDRELPVKFCPEWYHKCTNEGSTSSVDRSAPDPLAHSVTVRRSKGYCCKCQYKMQSRVLLVGHGADELLGGYGRHETANRCQGMDKVRVELIRDLRRLWHRNLGRDDRCLSHHGREGRHPFLDESVLQFIGSLSIDTVIEHPTAWPHKDLFHLLSFYDGSQNNDSGSHEYIYRDEVATGSRSVKPTCAKYNKWLVRAIAWRLGLRRCVEFRKRAIQFGSRLSKLSNSQMFGSLRKADGNAPYVRQQPIAGHLADIT